MKITLALLALASMAYASPTPVQDGVVVARDDYASYGGYGGYDAYPSVSLSTSTATPSATAANYGDYGSYDAYPTTYSSYTTYKRSSTRLFKNLLARFFGTN